MTSIKSLDDDSFTSLFHDFKESAFRLETLQKYAVDYEKIPFQDFMNGKERYTHPIQAEYATLVKGHTENGRSMSRVHVISEPLSDYVRFEILWPYLDSLNAGEDIRLLSTERNKWPQNLPKKDFWIFDSEKVAVMNYDDNGSFIGANLLSEASTVQKYLAIKKAAIDASIPYNAYVKSVM